MKYIDAKHDMSSLTTEFIAEDGTRYLRTGGTICWRFFNPGNIRPSKTSVCDPLKIAEGNTKNGYFMIFPDYDTGWAALKKLLSITYKDLRIDEICEACASKKDGNDPEKYTKFIIKKAQVNADDYIRDMDDQTLERVMEAIKQMEGYYNKKETQKETVIPTTNITISDGIIPLPNESVKVVIDQCTYEWTTNRYGVLPVIAHLPGREKIEVIAAGPDGKEDLVYSATAGATTQNVLLMKNFQVFTAKTGIHKEGEKSTAEYKVKKGDTLGKIARKLKTTVKRLADLNNIENVNVISIGQILIIPDGASKPQETEPTHHGSKPVYTGTSDKGYPQANIGIKSELAPWMDIAIREAKQWHGISEKKISDNYHSLAVKGSPNTLRGTPWCASFVTYCLKEAGANYSVGYAASSQFPVIDKQKFVEIDKPVYGALMVFRNYYDSTKKYAGSGHIAFVYGRTESGNIAALGGNQGGGLFDGGTIKLSEYSFSEKNAQFEGKTQYFYKCYYPVGWLMPKDDLQLVNIDVENLDVFKISTPSQSNEGGGR